MQDNLGYTKKLFILPFDHRSSFQKLGIREVQVLEAKKIIYEAFKKAVANGIPKEEAAILVDEQFGDAILQNARTCGFITILTTEKTGQEEFILEYGDSFGDHIEKYKPSFVKALVHYRPNANWTKLKILSDYCHNNGYKSLLEILTQNKTAEEAVRAIKEFQSLGIEPDVWKLEGMESQSDYQNIVTQAQSNGRSNVGVVVLGRGADQATVEKWIMIGAKVPGIIGFAVGRTVFWDPLTSFFSKATDRTQTIDAIAKNYLHFYTIFTERKNL